MFGLARGRHGDRRHHPGPHRQGRRLPAGRAGWRLPGLYHMVEIDPATGTCCRPCRRAATRSTSAEAVMRWRDGYIVGPLARTIFYEPGVKETDWSATAPVRGADGKRAALGLPALLQGRPADAQLARPDLRGAAPGRRRRSPLAQVISGGDAAPRRERLPRHRERPQDGPAWSEGHPLSPRRRTSSSPAWSASSAASPSRSST